MDLSSSVAYNDVYDRAIPSMAFYDSLCSILIHVKPLASMQIPCIYDMAGVGYGLDSLELNLF